LGCYFADAHFEVHPDDQDQLYFLVGGLLKLILCLEQTYNYLDGLLEVVGCLHCLLNQVGLELHLQQFLLKQLLIAQLFLNPLFFLYRFFLGYTFFFLILLNFIGRFLVFRRVMLHLFK
jgi:hypothetical protein